MKASWKHQTYIRREGATTCHVRKHVAFALSGLLVVMNGSGKSSTQSSPLISHGAYCTPIRFLIWMERSPHLLRDTTRRVQSFELIFLIEKCVSKLGRPRVVAICLKLRAHLWLRMQLFQKRAVSMVTKHKDKMGKLFWGHGDCRVRTNVATLFSAAEIKSFLSN